MARNRDISGGVFGPGVRPYTQKDADDWMRRNVPAPMRSNGPPPDRRMDVIRSGMRRTQIMKEEQAKRDKAAAANNAPSPGGPKTPTVSRPSLGGQNFGQLPQQAMPTGSYQSGINVGGGIGRGGVLAGLLDTGHQRNPNVSAFTRATARNDASQIGRGIDAQNQQLFMDQQGKRAESTTQGLSNLAQIYGDYGERGIQQIGLAGQIMKNNIGFAAGMSRLQRQPAFGALSSMNPFGR